MAHTKKIEKAQLWKNEDIDDCLIIAELEPAIVAPGSVIPPFPARKREVSKSRKKNTMTGYTTQFTVLSTKRPHVHDRYRVPHTNVSGSYKHGMFHRIKRSPST